MSRLSTASSSAVSWEASASLAVRRLVHLRAVRRIEPRLEPGHEQGHEPGMVEQRLGDRSETEPGTDLVGVAHPRLHPGRLAPGQAGPGDQAERRRRVHLAVEGGEECVAEALAQGVEVGQNVVAADGEAEVVEVGRGGTRPAHHVGVFVDDLHIERRELTGSTSSRVTGSATRKTLKRRWPVGASSGW